MTALSLKVMLQITCHSYTTFIALWGVAAMLVATEMHSKWQDDNYFTVALSAAQRQLYLKKMKPLKEFRAH